MDTKTYLSQAARYDLMVRNKIAELMSFRETCYGLSVISTEERVQTSLKPDKIGNIVAKLSKIEHELDDLIDEYTEKRHKIIEQIDGMEDKVLYNILFNRYIHQKTFERIAADMHYSFRQITRLHTKAIFEFEKRYGEQYL